MCTSFFATVLSFMQAVGDGTAQHPRDNLAAVLECASKESNLDRAASILWSYLPDESAVRSAFLTSEALDDTHRLHPLQTALGFLYRDRRKESSAL